MVAYHKPDNIRRVLIPSRLRECEGEIFNTKHYAENNNIGQPEEDTKIVDKKIEELNDDLNNKEIFDREMYKLNQHFNEINEYLTFNRYTKKIVKFKKN
jgi:hypothetical protein